MSDRPNDVFFFYLRSFKSEVATTEEWSFTDSRGRELDTVSGSPKVVLETLLKAAGPLIEVGGFQFLGVGQVKASDEIWWDRAKRLMIHSTANFLNPGATDSLNREIDFILDHKKLTRRTFLIMEPTSATMLSAASRLERDAAREREERWDKVVELFRQRGIDLPPYDAGGAIISLHTPAWREKFAGISRYRLYELMDKLFVDFTKPGSYDIAPDEPCPCGSGRTFADCHALGGRAHPAT